MVSNHGDCKSLRPGVVGPLPNDHSWLINGSGPNYVSKSWDDPPSGEWQDPKSSLKCSPFTGCWLVASEWV